MMDGKILSLDNYRDPPDEPSPGASLDDRALTEEETSRYHPESIEGDSPLRGILAAFLMWAGLVFGLLVLHSLLGLGA